MTDVKDKLIANNETINWIPETIGKGRFGEWLRNVQDWSISRDRYWGTPLNIWECECGHRHSIGSIAELKSMSDNCPDDIELHKPYIDAVTIKCPKCGGQMKRTKEVIDCWFDSGAMPFAQWHYPFENKEIFDDNFPADFISEALDQTRGWFYSLLAISTLIFDRAPYKNVIVLGLVQDENGQKMSKSKGNAVDPFDALKKHGADAIRWYFYSNSAPWLPNRFYDAAVTEGQRTFMGTLWNTYAFFVLYANIDNFDAAKHKLDESKMRVLDKWIISKLNTLTKVVDEYLGDYKITEAARALNSFVDELSNWYVRLSRERFWSSELTDDKTAAYMTLYTVLVTLSKLCAPMTPFMSESIYRNLVCSINPAAPESVHLCDYPVFDESKIDKPLEDKMEEVGEIVTLGRACRNAAAIKNRQPLSRMFVGAENELPEFYRDIILSELNIKSLEFTSEVGKYINYSFKPQLKTLGPKLGKSIGELKNLLAAIDGKAAMAELDATGYLKVKLSDGEKQIAKEDLLIERAKVDGFIADSDHGITVVLDTTLNEELIEEGYVREVISKLQTMRKEAGFEVMDNIAVFAVCDAMLCGIIAKNKSQIMHDTLAKSIELVPSLPEETGYAKDWSINGTPCSLSVKKL
ncbi:Isoleucine--tRNA ligase [bioreactor metagenome]|uniref:Isoleucine--tRNA ligase n=1 Tax=bioreactor metagenome TaxID=1076179 RepID=A0A645AQJ3_9ZZZZ